MKRRRSFAQTLGGKQKAAVIVVTVLVGFGLGFGVAHLMAGTIAYWGVISSPFFISLRVAVPATMIAGITGVASGYVLAKGVASQAGTCSKLSEVSRSSSRPPSWATTYSSCSPRGPASEDF
jgi:hypothetical protein